MAAEVNHRRRQRPEPVEQIARSRGRPHLQLERVAAAVLDRRFGLNHGFDFYYDHFNFSRLAEINLDFMERPAN